MQNCHLFPIVNSHMMLINLKSLELLLEHLILALGNNDKQINTTTEGDRLINIDFRVSHFKPLFLIITNIKHR